MSSEDIREFGRFRLDVRERVLWHKDVPVSLPVKDIELLCVLIENTGEVVTNEELLERVWADSSVGDTNLPRHIYLLRKTFKDLGESEDLIQTVPRRGYRFAAEVNQSRNADLVIERHALIKMLIEEVDEEPAVVTQQPIVARTANGRQLIGLSIRDSSLLVLVVIILATAITVIWVVGVDGMQHIGPPSASVPVSAVIPSDDWKFGGDGKVVTDFGFKVEKAQAVALQSDGKIVVGGWVGDSQVTSDFAVARYNADGSLDTGFDSDGKVVTVLGERTDIIYDLAVQPDGKILAAGVSFDGPKTRRFAIVRYKSDGSLDASFDHDGIVTLNIGTSHMDTAYAVRVQPDGKIVVAGSSLMLVASRNSRINQNDFSVVRLSADGSVDTSFGHRGSAIVDFGYGVDVAYDMALEPDGSIVVAGVATNGTDQDFAVARFQSSGTLDPRFGKGGKVQTDFFGEDDFISALALQPDGKILVAGNALKATASDFALARYSHDGSLDHSFNGNGKVTADLNGSDFGSSIGLQPDGRIVVAVQANIGIAPEMAFARLLSDGRLDESLNGVGKTRLSLQQPSEVFGMVLLPDGYAVSAGGVGIGKPSEFVLIRVAL
jgi:uncharacterized delta-60 repeat protein